MRKIIAVFPFILFFLPAFSQDSLHVVQLSQKIEHSASDGERINAIGELAEYYSVFNLSDRSDSLLQKAIEIADMSNDKSVIIKVLVNKNVANLGNLSNIATFDKAIAVIEKGVQYAQEAHDENLEALGYIRLADIFRKKQRYDEALQNTTKAITALSDVQADDTINIELFSVIGKIYADKADPVPAVKNYNKAFDLAYRIKNIRFQSKIYHMYAELYNYFHHTDEAKKYLTESVQLNKDNSDNEGLYTDYIDLARLTDQRDYIDMAIQKAKDIGSSIGLFKAKLLLYYWYMVDGKNAEQTLLFLNSNPDILSYFNNMNKSELCWERGSIYKYAGIYNYALDCFHTSASDILASHNPVRILDVYRTLGETHLQNYDTVNAIKYFEQAYKSADSLSQIKYLNISAQNLAILYAAKKEYQQAYFYRIKEDSVQQILVAKEAKDKLALLEIDRETKKDETDKLEVAHERTRKNNLQITAISILVAAFFFTMLFMGMFEVPKAVIRTLGYFAFISLFEFILLLLDHPVLSFTKGEPLRLWCVKILLIAILVPFQHFLEKGLVAFLQSRKLLEWRKKISIKKTPYPPPTVLKEPILTEDEEGEIL